ncbi:MAG TPA: cytochrome c [Solirubrobacterales bacterium]|jgi:mono/diheme cytochrome c family protein|nr:cytochrome c [Solirubrobacterales bacterium]
MSKRTFFIFGIVVVFFGLLLPYWAISKEGGESASPEKVAASDEAAKELFQTNCGACHTLARAGTDGIVGPNLDDLLGQGTPEANKQRVQTAIENGVDGRMPAGILQGENAEQVADFVARVAGQ